MKPDYIRIVGARQHNLKNVSLDIPKNKLVVFTGLSGSGKSSLAFDTIYAEGQRRYVESLSAYARQFLGLMDKPDVDTIEGLSPSIAIDQKATSHNPRSTVGTTTEIYDYLRLLYARVGHPHCPVCGDEISQQSASHIVQQITQEVVESSKTKPQARFLILAPVARGRKGEFKDLFLNLRKQGITLARIDGTIINLNEDVGLIKTNTHTIDAVLERLTFDKSRSRSESERKKLVSRLTEAVEAALKLSDGLVIVSEVADTSLSFPEKPKHLTDHLFSERFACPKDNISLPELEPRLFSFNSPHGACPTCHGLGSQLKIDPEFIVASELSLSEGAIIPLAAAFGHDTWFVRTVEAVLRSFGATLQTPFHELSKQAHEALLYGTGNKAFSVHGTNRFGRLTTIHEVFEGFVAILERRYGESDSEYVRHELERYLRQELCPSCLGERLKPESLSVTVNQKNIWEVTELSIEQAVAWMSDLKNHLSQREKTVADLILREIISRLEFLNSVGLNYLTLSREAGTLAGGEAQRIRLASQIGTGLTGVLYVLDEPTKGLHQRDNLKLIGTLKRLRDLGNTVIVVEHDRETMENADWIVDFGPLAGKHGGEVVAQGTPAALKKNPRSRTGQYLANKKTVAVSVPRTVTEPERALTLSGCTEHNLKNLTVTFPLSKLTCITGISGSGKSTLLHDTLYHALRLKLNRFHRERGGAFKDLEGAEFVHRVSLITQDPIGRTPRSNPVTYTKAFDHIRMIFAQTPEAKIRGYKSGRFSFNVKGGRCEACLGGGEVKIEMQFLPDVYVTCDVCQGRRYNEETLSVTFKNKTIADVLNMTVDEAAEFFAHIPAVERKLTTLKQVGLGYIQLGQPAPQLSGGEAQRIKLAKELSVRSFGHTVYLLDEPTTGLHFADLEKLLFVLKALVSQGNTVIVIEHNLDLIKNANWIIDLGPEGGNGGGEIVATGTPQDVARVASSYTGQFLGKLKI